VGLGFGDAGLGGGADAERGIVSVILSTGNDLLDVFQRSFPDHYFRLK